MSPGDPNRSSETLIAMIADCERTVDFAGSEVDCVTPLNFLEFDDCVESACRHARRALKTIGSSPETFGDRVRRRAKILGFTLKCLEVCSALAEGSLIAIFYLFNPIGIACVLKAIIRYLGTGKYCVDYPENGMGVMSLFKWPAAIFLIFLGPVLRVPGAIVARYSQFHIQALVADLRSLQRIRLQEEVTSLVDGTTFVVRRDCYGRHLRVLALVERTVRRIPATVIASNVAREEIGDVVELIEQRAAAGACERELVARLLWGALVAIWTSRHASRFK